MIKKILLNLFIIININNKISSINENKNHIENIQNHKNSHISIDDDSYFSTDDNSDNDNDTIDFDNDKNKNKNKNIKKDNKKIQRIKSGYNQNNRINNLLKHQGIKEKLLNNKKKISFGLIILIFILIVIIVKKKSANTKSLKKFINKSVSYITNVEYKTSDINVINPNALSGVRNYFSDSNTNNLNFKIFNWQNIMENYPTLKNNLHIFIAFLQGNSKNITSFKQENDKYIIDDQLSFNYDNKNNVPSIKFY